MAINDNNNNNNFLIYKILIVNLILFNIGFQNIPNFYYKFILFFRSDEEKEKHTLTFNISFPHDRDTVYLAHCYPYTYTDLQVFFLIKLIKLIH